MCACVLVAQSLVAAINLAIPKIAASGLHPSPAQMLWIVDIYVLVFAGLLIPAGALGDRVGRKGTCSYGARRVRRGHTAERAGGRAAGADGRAAPSRARGAALLVPATMSVLLHAAPPDRKAGAVAAWSTAVGAGGLAGNAGGG